VPLLHPTQASELLQLCGSVADVDLLLLSQLYQPGGLGPKDLVPLQQRLQSATAAAAAVIDSQDTVFSLKGAPSSIATSASSSQFSRNSSSTLIADEQAVMMQLLSQLPAVSAVYQPPAFPPPLHADVAYAAVAAYLRAGAFGKAAAVAHVSAVAHPRDIQQYHLLVRGAASAGAALPGVVMVEKLRENLWQVPTPKAQAAMLR
jgi:hypothetical protein